MGTAIVAAAAAILGALVAGLQQERRDRAAHRQQAEQQHREALAAALQELLKAATRNRQRQYAKHDDRRKGHPDTREDRDARYEARSRLTDALGVLVGLTTDGRLLESARCLVDTSIAVGEPMAATHDEIGDRARVAHGAMLRAITRHNQQPA
jgi:hypothetical protein